MYFPTVELVTAPAAEPVTRTEAKTHLRVTHTDDDTYIDGLITAARMHIENICNVALITQEHKILLCEFPCAKRILIPYGRLQSIDGFSWTDTAGTTRTWTVSGGNLVSGSVTMAHIDAVRNPAAIVLAYGQSWPSETLKTSNPIVIEFTCGYGDVAADVPQPIKNAMLLLIGHWYRNREAVVITDRASVESKALPLGVDALLANFRLHYA